MSYFSDRELGEKPREQEIITSTVWGGIVSLINTNIVNGGFGISFPEVCPDGMGTIGTDEKQMQLSARAEIPNISWPLNTTTVDEEDFLPEEKPFSPDTLDILDLIEFCHNNIAGPIESGYHDFFNHHHLTFDQDSGQQNFRGRINKIFARNGLAYKIEQNGQIIRLTSPVLSDALLNASLKTGDDTLNKMLQESREKFLSPDPSKRREALERLWDS